MLASDDYPLAMTVDVIIRHLCPGNGQPWRTEKCP